ncbi:helix-turn-helix domain-containing protein [Curtobacterium sp. NPDC089689]|uniref:helix-turn-helix domain-containing protein n=1 Tax=Curtobacterium sp. NPDC089689 TaxID=3363968 RepID=UPI0038016803
MNDETSRLDARADSLLESSENLLKGLIALRKKHNLSQAEVAERMSVSQPTVAAFERYDANPTQSTIQRYAMAVGARITITVIDDCEEHQISDDRFSSVLSASGTWSKARRVPVSVIEQQRSFTSA